MHYQTHQTWPNYIWALDGGGWFDNTNPAVVSHGVFSVTNRSESPATFFRLYKP